MYDDGTVAGPSARTVTALDAEGGPGATALLQGILATLSEALERLDGRLDTVEGGLTALTEALRTVTEDDGPDPDSDARGEAVQRALAAQRQWFEEAVDVQRAVLAEELERLAASFRQELEHDRGILREELERLGVLLRGQVAEVSGRADAVAAVLGRLEGRLHELVEGVRAVAQQARATRPADPAPELSTF